MGSGTQCHAGQRTNPPAYFVFRTTQACAEAFRASNAKRIAEGIRALHSSQSTSLCALAATRALFTSGGIMARPYLSKALRRQVAELARHRCGYCLTSQEYSGAQLEIEHIIPVSRGGSHHEDNLWLSCSWCNSIRERRSRDWIPRLASVRHCSIPGSKVGANILGGAKTG